jgi:type IV pilus assembly protein PilA
MKISALKKRAGFTLIELLVVIGILAILLAIVLIAINPARQFEQANDTQRSSDVNAILNAVHQYMAENAGTPPTGITTTPAEITEATATICTALVPTYIAALPADPTISAGPVDDCAAVTFATGYSISQSATDSRITVTSVQTPTITVTR